MKNKAMLRRKAEEAVANQRMLDEVETKKKRETHTEARRREDLVDAKEAARPRAEKKKLQQRKNEKDMADESRARAERIRVKEERQKRPQMRAPKTEFEDAQRSIEEAAYREKLR